MSDDLTAPRPAEEENPLALARERRDGAPHSDPAQRLESISNDFTRILISINDVNGDVSWPPAIVIARQRMDEAIMWATKASGCRSPD